MLLCLLFALEIQSINLGKQNKLSKLIELDTDSYKEILKQNAIVLLTSSQVDCPTCLIYLNKLTELKSKVSKNKKIKPIYFCKLEYSRGEEIFRSLNVDSIPVLLHISNGNADRVGLNLA